MPAGGAIVWYIEPQSFALRSAMIGAHELKGGSTYESEAMWKMPDNVRTLRGHSLEPGGQ